MATKAQRIKVGIFLVANVVLIVAGLALVAGYRMAEEIEYEVIFDESVLGLSEGGMVQFEGVPVGRVTDIRIGDDQQVHTRISVNVDKVKIYNGVAAKLELYSIATGTMTIALRGGDPKQGPHDPREPIIAEESLVSSFSAQLSDLMDDVGDILKEVKVGMKGMKEGALAKTVDETLAAIEEIKQLTSDVRVLAENTNEQLTTISGDVHTGVNAFEESMKDFGEFSQEGAKLARNADETVRLLHEKIEPVDLAAAVENLETRLAALVDKLNEVAGTVDTAAQTVVHRGSNIEYSFTKTLDSLNQTLDSVRELSDYLRENPSAVIRGDGPAHR